jgi:chromosome segregation ATPase
LEEIVRDFALSSVRFSFFTVVAALAACSVPNDPVVLDSTDDRETNREISRTREPALDAPDGSLATLTAEVRRLRVAVEDLARTQTEAQALAMRVTAQQTRVAQVADRLNAVRKEVESATAHNQGVEARLAVLSFELSNTTERDARAALDDQIRAIKAEQTGFDFDLQRARSRENELSRALQLEETELNDLISRIERLTESSR